jgi:hypothetical protein
MSGKRILRLFIGLIIALVLVPLVLPLTGVPRSHFLPPQWVYQQAKGQAQGVVLGWRYTESNDPFEVGTKYFFIKYVFLAMPPTPGATKMQHYYGEVQVTKQMYHDVTMGEQAPVKYELTYPEINGINYDGAGMAYNAANNTWYEWLALVVALAVIFMLVMERVGAKEDI